MSRKLLTPEQRQEKRREYSLAAYYRHHEEKKRRMREWSKTEAGRASKKRRSKRSYAIHREKILAQKKNWFDKNRDYVREKHREHYANNKHKWVIYRLARRYGITVKMYEEMLAKQNNVCAICNNPEIQRSKNGQLLPLAVDHCHSTGKIRSLLCSYCNRAIGFFGDDANRIKAAAEYILRHAAEV